MKKNPTYKEAFNELREIINEIEEGEVNVDLLSVKVKRAVGLIKVCKDKLASTEEDVDRILEELGEGD
ncbi:MAG: exodeoxyribonuclease VII small subunit [Bacteroidales bacterium]|nr:exodeoxyribonuclease VII small subunit [Bacteroidales bacterium]